MVALMPPQLLAVLSIIAIVAIAGGVFAIYERRYERSRHELRRDR
jgi:hypothetical protein